MTAQEPADLQPRFQTTRLLVRSLTADDFAAFHEMQSNPNVMRYTGTPPNNEIQNRQDLSHCIERYEQPENNFWIWAVCEKRTNQMVGTCAMVCDNNELGYRFLERFWGHGYGQEVLDGLIEYVFSELQVASVYAEVDCANVASVKILERSKLLMVREARNEKDGCLERFYELTSEQWNQS